MLLQQPLRQAAPRARGAAAVSVYRSKIIINHWKIVAIIICSTYNHAAGAGGRARGTAAGAGAGARADGAHAGETSGGGGAGGSHMQTEGREGAVVLALAEGRSGGSEEVGGGME